MQKGLYIRGGLQELHCPHNLFPLAPECTTAMSKWMSDYQKDLLQRMVASTEVDKLVPNLRDKTLDNLYYRIHRSTCNWACTSCRYITSCGLMVSYIWNFASRTRTCLSYADEQLYLARTWRTCQSILTSNWYAQRTRENCGS